MKHLRTVSLALVALLVIPAVAEAKKGPAVTVMTRNLFLGADLSPALAATTLPTGDRRRRRDLERAPAHAVPRARRAARARDQALEGGPRRAPGGRALAQADAVRPRGAAAQPEWHSRHTGRVRLPRDPEAQAEGLPGGRGSEGVRGRAPRRSGRQRRDGRPLRSGLRCPPHDARRDPGPEGQQGEARQDPEGALRQQVPGQRRRDRDPGRPRLGLRRGALPPGRQGVPLPLRRHAPGGLRRPPDPRGAGEGAGRRAARHPPARSSSSATSTQASPGTTSRSAPGTTSRSGRSTPSG